MKPKKEGVLLVNIGTPKEPTSSAVKLYLKRFLSDRRVIKKSPIIWQPILHGIILNIRPKKSAALYQNIWTSHGSPLKYYMDKQELALQQLLPQTIVRTAMSYSEPSIPCVLDELLEENITHLTVIPMYPQYSGTTVGSVFDEVMRYFYRSDKIIHLNFVRSFYERPSWYSIYSKKILDFLKQHTIQHIVFSYHGIPVEYVNQGDPYPNECIQSTEYIMQDVLTEYPTMTYENTFQSHFGNDEWLSPSTEAYLKSLPEQEIKNILVVAPGFVMDCLETIEELGEENRNYFIEAGGNNYYYLSALNDSIELTYLLKEIIQKNEQS
ncbi:ferrochelatase [Atopobacter phocae]|uniref:ferrochelatase n=1 Tax=Atopobacter phocae TaxID=136492 RepID=UPI000470BA86|nr:ferrochelatase [Atopobacter phocae]